MIDSTQIHFPSGSIRQKLLEVFINKINFCHGEYYDGTQKPDNKLYNWLYDHWLWPFENTGCVCCNSVRGVLYGATIGYIIGAVL